MARSFIGVENNSQLKDYSTTGIDIDSEFGSCPQLIDLILYITESNIVWGHCNH